METIVSYPRLVFVMALVLLWLAAWIGAKVGHRRDVDDELRADFSVVLGATLTLLGLIIGFSFSMAVSRYDQRKNYEAEEANAIGTEYSRTGLLPQADGARVRDLLRQYTNLRIRFYETRDQDELRRVDAETARVQDELWIGVSRPAVAQPTPVMALAVGGMNDVLNSQGYTQAAWWNRIPVAAWALMFAIAIFSNWLFGYGTRRMALRLFLVFPLVVATSFFLIADIDSPRRGTIRVHPQNLISLQASMK